MYDIAHDAHKDSLKHFPLWLAIVSLTDQYVRSRCRTRRTPPG